jgi:hypothetical protein
LRCGCFFLLDACDDREYMAYLCTMWRTKLLWLYTYPRLSLGFWVKFMLAWGEKDITTMAVTQYARNLKAEAINNEYNLCTNHNIGPMVL